MLSKKQIAIDAVVKATKLCEQVQAELVSTDAIQKNDRSPVTVADFGSQALICKAIGDAFPEDVIVAEENAQSLKQNSQLLERVTDYVNRFCKVGAISESRLQTEGRRHAPSCCPQEAVVPAATVCKWIDRGNGEVGQSFWTLDPIDGTKGFLRRDQYAIALAWIVDGEVQLGVLGCPNLSHQLKSEETDTPRHGESHRGVALQEDAERGCLFVAARGQGTALYTTTGTFLAEVRVSENARRLAESFESTHSDSDAHSNIAKQLGLTAPPIQMDSQAKYGIVARGEASLYIRLPNPASPDYRECIWDHAAGLIVVEEAGGTVTDARGAPLNFMTGRRMVENRGIVATNGNPLHNQVLSILTPSCKRKPT